MAANTGVIKIALKMKDDGTIKVLRSTGAESEKTGMKGKKAFSKMDRSAKSFTKSANAGAKSIISMKTAVLGLISVGGVVYLQSMAGGFIEVAKSFERYEMQLKTITGSSEKAKASMAWITEFTAKTPYELGQVTNSFIKLEAYGLKAPRWMRTLGDTSAAMGKDLNQTVEMFADAVVGEFERLKEFGVKTSVQGDKVSFKWSQNGQDMIKTTEKTQSGISNALSDIFRRFDGSMEELSTSWGGMTSNMSDTWMTFKKQVMDSGPFHAMKAGLGGFLNYLSTNEGQMDLKTWAQNTAVGTMHAFKLMTQSAHVFYEVLYNSKSLFSGLMQGVNELRLKGVESSIRQLNRRKESRAGQKYTNAIKLQNAQRLYDLEKEREAIKANIGYWESSGISAQNTLRKAENNFSKIEKRLDEYSKKTKDVKLFGGAEDIDGMGNGKGSNRTSKKVDEFKSGVDGLFDSILLDDDDRWMREVEEFEAALDSMESKAVESAGIMEEAFSGWATSYSSTLNDMLWESKFAFDDILRSFGKMITQMAIQKSTLSLFDWGGSVMGSVGSWVSGLFNAHGNAFGKSGHIQAYAHGGPFTNKVVDKPTMFAHGGGLGIMGEKTPEVIAPLFRASNGDMGVKAVVESSAQPINVRLEVINNTGTETEVKKQEPRFDGVSWVCGVVLEKVRRSRAYKQNMNAALGRA